MTTQEEKKRQAKIDALIHHLDNMNEDDWAKEHKKNVQTWVENSLTKTIPADNDKQDKTQDK